jgi:AP-2 complex subunit alpha
MFPPPAEGSNDLTKLNDILLEIVNKTEVTKNVNKNNSDHSILFEAINLIIHYKNAAYEVLRKDIVTLLGKFISVKEPNIRYLALEIMSKLSGI